MPSDAAKKRQAQKRERRQGGARGAQKKVAETEQKKPTCDGPEASASSSSPSLPGTSSDLAESVAGMKLASATDTARSCTGMKWLWSFLSQTTIISTVMSFLCVTISTRCALLSSLCKGHPY